MFTSCDVIGDSIAVGVGMYSPHCITHAKKGWTSKHWIDHYLHKIKLNSELTVISLGTNDWYGIDTDSELRILRKNITSNKVVWIIPAIKPRIKKIILKIAEENGDATVTIPELSPDHIHPTGSGYKKMAKKAQA